MKIARAHLLCVALASLSCTETPASTNPEPRGEMPSESTAAQTEFKFVSTEHNKQGPTGTVKLIDDAEPTKLTGDYAVTTPEGAREFAEQAIADQLDLQRTWRTSPVLPTSWPPRDKTVMYLFYPMAASETTLSKFLLFSAAYRVDVSLVDGATTIKPLGRARKLGMVEETRAATLERNELDLAERALIHRVLEGAVDLGENNFWGYLKYFHEHPQFARDIKVRVPTFVAWLQKRK